MELITYKKFNDEEIAIAIGDLLQKENINCDIENTNTFFDPSYSFNKANFNILLKIKNEDFIKANLVLEKFYQDSISDVDKDYYLYSFSNNELLDILQKQDEWGEFDVALTKKILKERGNFITEKDISYLEKQRSDVLAKPEKIGLGFLILGYVATFLNLFYLFFPSQNQIYRLNTMFPILIASFVIWNLLYFKKTLPNGEQVLVYEKSSQKHALYIFILLLIGIVKIAYNLISD